VTPEHKAKVLQHCLWMAQTDPDYAIWAAGWYEQLQPKLLENLQAKVRQEVKRAQKEQQCTTSTMH
jgi:hypothetical protein